MARRLHPAITIIDQYNNLSICTSTLRADALGKRIGRKLKSLTGKAPRTQVFRAMFCTRFLNDVDLKTLAMAPMTPVARLASFSRPVLFGTVSFHVARWHLEVLFLLASARICAWMALGAFFYR